MLFRASLVAQIVKNLPTMQETQVRSLGWGDPLEEGMATPQYSCLENPMDREDWWAMVLGVAKNWTRLKRLSTHARVRMKVN